MAIKFWYSSKLLYEENAEGHHYTAYCNVRTLPFTNSGAFPKYTQQSSFISVQEAGCQGSDVSTGTYKQQDYCQQTLKIENGRLFSLPGDPGISFENFLWLILNFPKRPKLSKESAITQNNTHNLKNLWGRQVRGQTPP